RPARRGPRARRLQSRGSALPGVGAAVVAARELPRDRAHRGRAARAPVGAGRRRQRGRLDPEGAVPLLGLDERTRRARALRRAVPPPLEGASRWLTTFAPGWRATTGACTRPPPSMRRARR